ncbi:MAG: EI24 domain-containing protein [Bacteroidota bacterium]
MSFFYFSLFKYVILIIGSPVFAYLSEKTEAIIENKEHTFNWPELKKDAARSIRLVLRNCLSQTMYLIGVALMSLLPLIGWITPIIALLMECYYYGISMLDYSFARNGFYPSKKYSFYWSPQRVSHRKRFFVLPDACCCHFRTSLRHHRCYIKRS